MNIRTKKIVEELKRRIIEKYKLQDIRIFGSSVRGEQREDSDIDKGVKGGSKQCLQES